MSSKLLGGRYQVVQVLAIGGFGRTYIAKDMHRPGNPQCVVKHLQPISANSRFLPNARRMFQTEAEILEKLGNHDQIPRLLAYFEENQEFYLAQEFVPGHTLTAGLQPGKRWNESQVHQLLQEVLSILVFVHGHGVIHRDIKPDNLIRRQHDSRLVLVDFGSVKQAWTQVITTEGQTSSTFANSLSATIAIGTPGYMPTEQGRGRPQPNSDLYALGMIAIQALTGRNPTQLIEESDNGEIAWRNQADVSETLASILTKMVRYNCKNRYQTAKEVLKELQQLLNSLSLPQLELVAGICSEQHCLTPTTSLLWQPSPERLSNQNSALFTLPTASASNGNLQTKFVTATQPDLASTSTATTVSTTQPTIFAPLAPQTLTSKNSSKNIIPHEVVNSSTSQKQRQESHRVIPFPQNQKRLKIGAAITAILLGVVAIYSIELPPLARTQRTQEQVATEAAGKYQECANKARANLFVSKARTLLYQCRLAQAKQLAADENFPVAIAEASKIPQTDATYAAAQQLIAQWSNSLLARGKNQYNLGKPEQAIALAKSIPKTSPVYQQAQGTIKQWQKEWDKNNSSWQAAKSALAAGKLQNALSAAKQVSDTPYWQNKVQPIVQQAEAKIASQPKRSSTRQPTRTPTRQGTQAVTRRQIRTVARPRLYYGTRRQTRTVARARPRVIRRQTRTTLKRYPTSITRTRPGAISRRFPASVTRTRSRAIPRRLPPSISKRSTRVTHKRTTRSAKIREWNRRVTKTRS